MPAVVRVQSNILPTPRLLVVFGGLALALLISFIDQNAVSVVLPVLAEDLDAAKTISWAGTSSLIANTVFQVLYGRVSDIIGRKTVFLVCIGLLVLGDLLCGFAKTGPQLYAFRGIAGVGNGGIAALAMIIVSDTVTLERRGKFQGILGGCVGLGNVAGPFLAAAVTKSWRWQGLFWIVCVLAFASGIIVMLVVPPSRITGSTQEKIRAIDYWGLLSSSGGLILVLIAISMGGVDFPWNHPAIISMLTIGTALLIVFIIVEQRWASMPLLPLKFFRNPPVCAIMVQNFLIGIVYYSNLYFLPIYYQCGRQWSLMRAAIFTIPFVASQSVVSILSGQYISHFQRYGEIIWCGYGLWTLGSGLTLLFDSSTQPWVIVLVLIVEGAGVGLTFQPTLVAVQAHTEKEDRAVVTSVRNFTRSVGGATGMVMSTAIFSNKFASKIASLPAATKSQIMDAVLSVPDLSMLSVAQTRTVLEAYVSASRQVFLSWVILEAICLLLCILIKDRGLSRKDSAKLAGSSDEKDIVTRVDLDGMKDNTESGRLVLASP